MGSRKREIKKEGRKEKQQERSDKNRDIVFKRR